MQTGPVLWHRQNFEAYGTITEIVQFDYFEKPFYIFGRLGKRTGRECGRHCCLPPDQPVLPITSLLCSAPALNSITALRLHPHEHEPGVDKRVKGVAGAEVPCGSYSGVIL